MRKLKITELNRISAEEFKQVEKLPLVVVLDDIRSLHNIGSVFRTSDAFRIECIYLCGITATPPHPEMHKTALGAEFTVDWKYVNTVSYTHLFSGSYAINPFTGEAVPVWISDYVLAGYGTGAIWLYLLMIAATMHLPNISDWKSVRW